MRVTIKNVSHNNQVRPQENNHATIQDYDELNKHMYRMRELMMYNPK
jgi:hypothetical protein